MADDETIEGKLDETLGVSYNPETKTFLIFEKKAVQEVHVQGGVFEVMDYNRNGVDHINVRQTITTEKDLEYFKRQQQQVHPFYREDLEIAEELAKVFKKA